MDLFDERLAELVTWVKSLDGCPEFEGVRLLDGRGVNGGVAARMSLRTPDAFASRFGDLYARHLPWLNLRAVGIYDERLLVLLESPADSTSNRDEQTQVTLAGPSDAVRGAPDWALGEDLRVV